MKYICFYDCPNDSNYLGGSLAAYNKINYVVDSITDMGFEISIVSVNWRKKGIRLNYHSIRQGKTASGVPYKIMANFESKNKILHRLGAYFSLFRLTINILSSCKKGEKIIVYHSPWLYFPIMILKKIRKVDLLLQVEEIYSDVSCLPYPLRAWEQKIINLADSYLISSNGIKKKIKQGNPTILCSGIYNQIIRSNNDFGDGKIHLVYAGIIDHVKKGAFNAIHCSKYLPNNYVIHILGEGGGLSDLLNEIVYLNSENECQCIYEGLKHGEELLNFCSKCNIGLSTQDTMGEYSQTSFPSKIFTYLSCGLSVVSCKLKCLEDLGLDNIVYTYSDSEFINISRTIREISFVEEKEIKKKLDILHNAFINELMRILKKTKMQ